MGCGDTPAGAAHCWSCSGWLLLSDSAVALQFLDMSMWSDKGKVEHHSSVHLQDSSVVKIRRRLLTH